MLDIVTSYYRMQFQGKPMIQTQENGKKPHFGPDLVPFNPSSGRQFFSQKIWLRHSVDIMVRYQHVQYQKKLMIQSRENLVTDGRTGRQTEESDFIGRCRTNVERPKIDF